MKKFVLLLFLFFLFIPPAIPTGRSAIAQDSPVNYDELAKQIQQLEQQLAETQARGKTLASQVSYMNNQIKLTTLKINETQKKISQLIKEIDSLSQKIDRLEESLDQLSKVLLARIVETYKRGNASTFQLLFSSGGFSEFLTRLKYIKTLQVHDKKLILEMQLTKNDYSDQKQTREAKKLEQENLRRQLVDQTSQLARQKKDKEALLVVTQNDEKRYQELLKKALEEIASLKGFTQEHAGGILPPQQSPDGWFYSQRDERWATKTIGYSQETIFDVGCLISDIAMVFTYYGDKKTPADIAGNSSYFFSQTAYMLRPWPSPAGKSMIELSNMSAVDSELSSERPVIVHLNLGGDGHFVVLKKKEGDDYLMHDPWYGYDKKFKDYYSVNSINQRVVYK